jgi:hypothetical protein
MRGQKLADRDGSTGRIEMPTQLELGVTGQSCGLDGDGLRMGQIMTGQHQ